MISKKHILNKLTNVLMLDNEEKVLKMTKNYFSSSNIDILIAKNINSARNRLKKKH